LAFSPCQTSLIGRRFGGHRRPNVPVKVNDNNSGAVT
jgi:hypothetical protein